MSFDMLGAVSLVGESPEYDKAAATIKRMQKAASSLSAAKKVLYKSQADSIWSDFEIIDEECIDDESKVSFTPRVQTLAVRAAKLTALMKSTPSAAPSAADLSWAAANTPATQPAPTPPVALVSAKPAPLEPWPSTMESTFPPPKPKKSNTWLWVLLGGASLGLVTIIAILVSRSRSGGAQPRFNRTIPAYPPPPGESTTISLDPRDIVTGSDGGTEIHLDHRDLHHILPREARTSLGTRLPTPKPDLSKYKPLVSQSELTPTGGRKVSVPQIDFRPKGKK